MAYNVISHQVLQGNYFYPVDKNVFVATRHRIAQGQTPQMIMDADTLAVYLVDDQGNLFMQPKEMFDPKILRAPLWKTIPLPKEEFQRQVLTPVIPSRALPSRHAHQQGYSPQLDTYMGKESPYYRARRESMSAYPVQSTPLPSRTATHYTQSNPTSLRRSHTQSVRYVSTANQAEYYLEKPRKTVRFA